jgi:hypothetical protein
VRRLKASGPTGLTVSSTKSADIRPGAAEWCSSIRAAAGDQRAIVMSAVDGAMRRIRLGAR